MMRLIAFRIRNFRSIVDTGWQKLSPDNITCLIGQNESGKTSILEALKVFHSGVISEDVLRSDLSLPEVSCRFGIPDGWLLKITEDPGAEMTELLKNLDHLELTRKWLQDFSSVISVSGEISQYLDSLDDAWKAYLNDVSVRLGTELAVVRELETRLTGLTGEENSIRNTLGENTGHGLGFRLFRKRSAEQPVRSEEDSGTLRNRLREIRREKEELISLLGDKQAIRKSGEKWIKLTEQFNVLDDHLKDLSLRLEERHQKMTLLAKPPDESGDHEWKLVVSDFRKTRIERDQKKAAIDRQVALSGYIIDGIAEADAEQKVDKIINSYKSQYNSEVLGRKYFESTPVFEMFEDFGSLLPNRIDLDDIISGNEHVEGYKAARNFLSIAQLDYSFFQQPSSRILKQKIENLNYTLTRNFHDFWQQSIGSNNKIHIQFELEHYNASYGAKAGKPYLEFWIKDEGERLYPKQRSRGVRWFLSFYMELKACAGNENKQLILLVDEPGVSLHARAQEDVLKVFDDIREKIQVIYTTHSPHLVDLNKLHRVLAVQRDDLDSLRSYTRIIDPLRLSEASPDTLTPLQNILGNRVGAEGFAPGRINLIVNDTGSFYMLNAIILLTGFKGKLSVIPSTNVSSIPLLCNILLGWGMDFAILIFENDEELEVAETLGNTVYKTDTGGRDPIIRIPEAFLNAEDLLSTLDFKNHILNSREGITVPNSVYIREKELPRNFLLSRFLNNVRDGRIRMADLDEESTENFMLVAELLKGLK
jgi:predicted ATP-dependent endonuclease of OLD family